MSANRRIETKLFDRNRIPQGQLFLRTALVALQTETSFPAKDKPAVYTIQYPPTATATVQIPIVLHSQPSVDRKQVPTRFSLGC